MAPEVPKNGTFDLVDFFRKRDSDEQVGSGYGVNTVLGRITTSQFQQVTKLTCHVCVQQKDSGL